MEDDDDFDWDDDDDYDIEEPRMREVPVCCGAAYDPGGWNIRGHLKASGSLQSLAEHDNVGFIFTDVEIPGMTKVHDKLWYWSGESWEPDDTYTYHQYGEMFPEKYRKAGYLYNAQWLDGTVLHTTFPTSPYNIEWVMDEWAKAQVGPELVILAQSQLDLYEGLLVKYGFKPIARAINPKHESQMTFYFKEANNA